MIFQRPYMILPPFSLLPLPSQLHLTLLHSWPDYFSLLHSLCSGNYGFQQQAMYTPISEPLYLWSLCLKTHFPSAIHMTCSLTSFRSLLKWYFTAGLTWPLFIKWWKSLSIPSKYSLFPPIMLYLYPQYLPSINISICLVVDSLPQNICSTRAKTVFISRPQNYSLHTVGDR